MTNIHKIKSFTWITKIEISIVFSKVGKNIMMYPESFWPNKMKMFIVFLIIENGLTIFDYVLNKI
jgi:hypothetical protein